MSWGRVLEAKGTAVKQGRQQPKQTECRQEWLELSSERRWGISCLGRALRATGPRGPQPDSGLNQITIVTVEIRTLVFIQG